MFEGDNICAVCGYIHGAAETRSSQYVQETPSSPAPGAVQLPKKSKKLKIVITAAVAVLLVAAALFFINIGFFPQSDATETHPTPGSETREGADSKIALKEDVFPEIIDDADSAAGDPADLADPADPAGTQDDTDRYFHGSVTAGEHVQTPELRMPISGGDILVTEDRLIWFTPDTSGIWEIFTWDNGLSYPYLEVYAVDRVWLSLGYDYGSAGNRNAQMILYLEAGVRYSIGVWFFDNPAGCRLTARLIEPCVGRNIRSDLEVPWKIAIVTLEINEKWESFRAAEVLVGKYGADRVIHFTCPVGYFGFSERIFTIIENIAYDPDIRALVISPAELWTSVAIDMLMEIRDDIFIVYCDPIENPADVASRADLVLRGDDYLFGSAYVTQAKAMSAETIVHYSFPRHMEVPGRAFRRDVMRAAAERDGIRFIEIETPDPSDPGGPSGLNMFLLDDVPRQIAKFGRNTAFFGTLCEMQTPLIMKVFEYGALYPQACCSSPYHGFTEAFQIVDTYIDGSNIVDGADIGHMRPASEIVEEIRSYTGIGDMSGRLSSWAVPEGMLWTTLGAEYAILWIEGDVSQSRHMIDLRVLHQLADRYTLEYAGERVGVTLSTFNFGGVRYNHFVMGVGNFLKY